MRDSGFMASGVGFRVLGGGFSFWVLGFPLNCSLTSPYVAFYEGGFVLEGFPWGLQPVEAPVWCSSRGCFCGLLHESNGLGFRVEKLFGVLSVFSALVGFGVRVCM